MPQNRALSVVLAVVGVILIVVAVVYFAEPASSLPSFLPGHDALLARHHTTHGIASLLVGIAALIGAWMVSPRPGKASADVRRPGA